jgi:ribosomal protein L19E
MMPTHEPPIDVSLSPADVAAMITTKLGRDLVEAQRGVTIERRAELVDRALDAMQSDIERAIEYRNKSLGEALGTVEAMRGKVEQLVEERRSLRNDLRECRELYEANHG